MHLHTAITCFTALLLCVHIDPTLVHTQLKNKQGKSNYYYNSIATYVPATNVPFKTYRSTKYTNQFMCTYEVCISIYMSRINSLDEQWDQDYWYTYISHYWYMSMTQYGCHIVNISFTVLLL